MKTKMLFLLLFCYSCLNRSACAQMSKCPYDYFQSANSRDYYSFKISFRGQTKLACGTLSDVVYMFKKQNSSVEKWQVVDWISRGKVLNSTLEVDSLNFLYIANDTDVKKADDIAIKGEKYFLNFFFTKEGCIKPDNKINEAAIVKHLQNWCIVARQDDESGLLCAKYKYTLLSR